MATLAEEVQTLLSVPAMAPPPGMTPNFIDPPNLQHVVILILTVCTSLATLTVMLRIFTKIFIIHQTTFDDCTFSCPAISKYSNTDASQTSF